MSPRVRKSLSIATVAMALTALGPVAARAAGEPENPARMERSHGPGHHGHDGPRGERILRMMEGLDLSEAQRADIQEIVVKNRDELRSLVDDLVEARKNMRSAVSASEPDEREIRATSERLVKAQTAVALKRARLASDVRALLTPEQRKQLEAKKAEMRDQMRERKQHRHSHDHQSRDGKSDSDSTADDSL